MRPIGGDEPGLRGGQAKGKKVLTGIAVEVTEPKGIGRCRMAVLADGSSASLHPFVTSHVEPGAKVITDAWMGYHGLAGLGRTHERRSQRASGLAPGRRQAAPGEGAACAEPRRAGYGLMAKLRVVQPALEALPPGAASIELPQTWPVVPVAGAAGSGVAAA